MRASRRTTAIVLAIATAGLGTATPAQAAPTHALGIRAIDSAGKNVRVGGQFINVRTQREYGVRAGRTVRVPRGTYAATSMIWSGEKLTIGTQVLSVTRNRTVVFDTRKGRLVRFRVTDDPTAEVTGLNVLPLVRGRWAMSTINGWTPPKGTYVIPAKGKDVTFVAHAALEKRGSSEEQPSPYRYDLVRVIKGGIPKGVSFSDTTAKLARVGMAIRSFDDEQTGSLDLTATSRSNSSYLTPVNTWLGKLPRRLVSYRSPGFKWQPRVEFTGQYGDAVVSDSNNDPFYRRGRFQETWGQGVWGPSRRAPTSSLIGRRLEVNVGSVICQPPRSINEDCEFSGLSRQARLYRGGKLIRESKGNVRVQLPVASHWYRLQVTATRPRGALLSTRMTGVWRFKARGNADVGAFGPDPKLYTVQFVPRGLDLRNRAARGTQTSIPLWIQSGYDRLGKIRSIKLEASVDGGRTWRRTAVKREQKHWVTQVRNPATPGFVWLRATVVDAAGNSVVQTIANAYGVR